MKTMTIEERAKDVVSKIHICIENGKPITPSRRIMNALTEQDHISRQDQREEDIQRAKEWLKENLTTQRHEMDCGRHIEEYYESTYFGKIEELINEFEQAMKGE